MGSHLQVSVEPSQSSFFAGEEFACTITFTNTREPEPQTLPLPSRPTFDNVDTQRRVASSIPAANFSNDGNLSALPLSKSNSHSPTPSLAGNPLARRMHHKSQSVDIRTYARKHQLEQTHEDEDVASDEKYYQTLKESNGQGQLRDNDPVSSIHVREMLQSLPGRQFRIGRAIVPDTQVNDSNEVATPQKKRHNKAYSLASPHEHTLGLGFPERNAPFSTPKVFSHRFPIDAKSSSPISSRAPSTALRQPSGTIASSHPHSRKKSVIQVQNEDLSATFELENSTEVEQEGLSSFRSSLDGIPRDSVEVRDRSNQNGFYGVGENSTMESVLREDMTRFAQSRNEGQDRVQSPLYNNKRSAPPGTETVLWAFAQFGGQFQVDESLVKPGEFERIKQRLAGMTPVQSAYGSYSSQSLGVGGGELGNDVEHSENNADKGGWTSYLRGVLSSGAGSKRGTFSVSHKRAGSTLLDSRQKTISSRTIPILSNPPSIIAVDLQLAPGESKSYTFQTPLPPDLPPSYKGKAISFNYTLTLGTNRISQTKQGSLEQKSRLVRIPMRIYNHVNISGVTAFFDLTNPIISHKDESRVVEEENTNGTTDPLAPRLQRGSPFNEKKRRPSRSDVAGDQDLLQYTSDLLQSCRTNDNGEHQEDMPTDVELATKMAQEQRKQRSSASPTLPRRYLPQGEQAARYHGRTRQQKDSQEGLGFQVDDDDLPKNSLQAVELLSRNSQKVSYDISKDGHIAAVLTLIKSQYRLGDTIMGVVSINTAHSIARVVRLAATLETHEEIETTLATLPTGRTHKLTRTIHASHHDSTLDTGQVCFSLAIPSGATPNFNTSAVRLAWTVRLAFLTLSNVRPSGQDVLRLRPPAHLVSGPDDGYSAFHRTQNAISALPGPWTDGNTSSETKIEVVECAVPLTVLPHSTRFTVGEVAFAV